MILLLMSRHWEPQSLLALWLLITGARAGDNIVFDFVDFDSAKRNIRRQGTKVLHDIASAYDRGVLDDAESARVFMSLLACICEGKVEGRLDEVTGEIKWALTKEYSELMNQKLEEIAKSSPNVVEGPGQ